MALKVVLDTSAYSHFRAGHQGVLARLSKAEQVLVPSIVLGELEAAFRLGTRYRENRVTLDRFLDEPFVDVADIGGNVALRYGQVFAELRRAGTPLPINDVWIAATTLDAGGHLLTFDSDFARVAGLSCEVLPVGGE